MSILNVFFFALIPAVSVVVGGIIAAFRSPGQVLHSMAQHFAAGVVFAAVSIELLPDLKHEGQALPTIIGFAIGVVAMLALREFTAKPDKGSELNVRQPTSLIATVSLDILIDGLLVGIGFALGATEGILLTFALTIEIFFLGLSVSATLSRVKMSRKRVIGASLGLAVLFIVGALLGATVLSTLSGFAFTLVLAFGLASLLYLVAEELLSEAHEFPDTPLITAMFFLGFLVLLIVSILAEQ